MRTAPHSRSAARLAVPVALVVVLGSAPTGRGTVADPSIARARQAIARLPVAVADFRAGRYDEASHGFARILRDLPAEDRGATGAAWIGLSSPRDYTRVLAGLHSNLGMAHYRARRFDEAEVHLRAALDLQPSSGAAAWQLGLTRTQQHDYAQAAEWLERARRATPTPSAELLLDLGEVHLRLGNALRARWALAAARARALAGRDLQAWGTALEADVLIAQADLADGRLAHAARRLESVLSRAPGHVAARTALSQALARGGRIRAAARHERIAERHASLVAAIHATLANESGRVSATQWVADTYRALGLYHLAEAHYRQLAARSPKDGRAALALDDLRVRAGVVGAAAADGGSQPTGRNR